MTQSKLVPVAPVRMRIDVGEFRSPVPIGDRQDPCDVLHFNGWDDFDRITELWEVQWCVVWIDGQDELDALRIPKRPQKPLQVAGVESLASPFYVLHDQQYARTDRLNNLRQAIEQFNG